MPMMSAGGELAVAAVALHDAKDACVLPIGPASIFGAALGCKSLWPDPAAMAARYGAETAVIDWHARLVCSGCGGRHVDFVVSGTERR
jgi:hypothetical protein